MKHTNNEFGVGSTLVLQREDKNDEVTTFTMSVDEIKAICEEWTTPGDIIIFQVPDVDFQHANIRNHFITEDQFNILLTTDVRGYFGSSIPSHCMLKYQPVVKVTGKQPWECNYDVSDCVYYRLPTAAGDCGTPMYSFNPKFHPGKLIGIHIAGAPSVGLGYACMLTRERLSIILDGAVEPQCMKELVGDRFVKEMPSPSRQFTSQIMRSPLYEEWGPATRGPAVIRPVERDGVKQDPMKLAMKRYLDKKETPIDPDLLSLAGEHLGQTINQNLEGALNRALTFEEAVLGMPLHNIEPINRKTSAGVPWSVLRPGKGKEPWFGKGEVIDLCTEAAQEVKAKVLHDWEMCKRGETPEYIFSSFLKDELVKLKKILDLKTRLVCGSPMDLTVLIVMAFGGFSAHVMKNRISNGCCVGIDVHSEEWDMLAREMQNLGPDCGAGDFKEYDSLQLYQIMLEILDSTIQPFYTDDLYILRKILIWVISHSLHVVDGVVYRWFMSLPSGCALTTIMNTLYQGILFRLCWLRASPNKSLDNYRANFKNFKYGDDGSWNVSPWAKTFFNQVTLVELMKEFGMVYTNDTKTVATGEITRPLSQITFLKRAFRWEKSLGRYVAPLDLSVVEQMGYWTKRGLESDIIFRNNVETSLRELTYHGFDTFQEVSQKIVSKCREKLDWIPANSNYFTNMIRLRGLKEVVGVKA
jgi:hypothetical protein